jgi:hypothetical protein
VGGYGTCIVFCLEVLLKFPVLFLYTFCFRIAVMFIDFGVYFAWIYVRGWSYPHPRFINHHHHQGLDPLIRSVSRVTTALANVSSVFQLFFFLVVCSDIISKGFGLVAFFASAKTSSVCIQLPCLVCIQSVVHGVRSLLFCGHEGCSLLGVSITSFLPPQFFVSVRLSESNFLTHIKM